LSKLSRRLSRKSSGERRLSLGSTTLISAMEFSSLRIRGMGLRRHLRGLGKGWGKAYALVKAIVGLGEEALKKYWVKHCYMFSQDYGSILRRIWEIMWRQQRPLPTDFALLKAYGLYCKSGSRRHPGNSTPLEIVPAAREALGEWRESRDIRGLREHWEPGQWKPGHQCLILIQQPSLIAYDRS